MTDKLSKRRCCSKMLPLAFAKIAKNRKLTRTLPELELFIASQSKMCATIDTSVPIKEKSTVNTPRWTRKLTHDNKEYV